MGRSKTNDPVQFICLVLTETLLNKYILEKTLQNKYETLQDEIKDAEDLLNDTKKKKHCRATKKQDQRLNTLVLTKGQK